MFERKSRPSMACSDCGDDTWVGREHYMVRDVVWKQAGAHKCPMVCPAECRMILCIGCLEARLGRELSFRDFSACPLNNEATRRTTSERLWDRLHRDRPQCRVCKGWVPLRPKKTGHYCSVSCSEKAMICTVNGCTNERTGTGTTCSRHRVLPEVPGYRDMYCKLCGYGPRVKLYHHVNRDHGGTAAYRKQFGEHSLVSDGYRQQRATLYEQWTGVETVNGRRKRVNEPTGLPTATPRRQKVCRNGHAMRGHNVMLSTNVVHGREYTLRQCRKCWNDWHNQHRREKRAANPPAWKGTTRICDHCGESFEVLHARQRFCSKAHLHAYHSAQRRRITS